MIYRQIENHLLASYNPDDLINKAKANISNFRKSRISPPYDTERRYEKKRRYLVSSSKKQFPKTFFTKLLQEFVTFYI